jgi:hypothetical protein
MTDINRLESKFRRLAELREERDIAKEAEKQTEAAYREYEAELLSEVEESALRGTVEFDFGGDLGKIRFQPRSTIYGRVIDKMAALEAFDAAALTEEMTAPKIEARRLNELVRDYMESGRELPEGVDYYERKYFTISRKD